MARHTASGTRDSGDEWGMLVDDMIQCPRHLARFSLADGSCSGGWQLAPLRRYEVQIEDGNILLKDPLVALE